MSETNQLMDAIHAVMEKSISDAEFRRKALADPGAALREAGGGAEIPASPRVRFVDELDELVIVLPPRADSAEIGDAELSSISGGIHLDSLPANLAAQFDSLNADIAGAGKDPAKLLEAQMKISKAMSTLIAASSLISSIGNASKEVVRNMNLR